MVSVFAPNEIGRLVAGSNPAEYEYNKSNIMIIKGSGASGERIQHRGVPLLFIIKENVELLCYLLIYYYFSVIESFSFLRLAMNFRRVVISEMNVTVLNTTSYFNANYSAKLVPAW